MTNKYIEALEKINDLLQVNNTIELMQSLAEIKMICTQALTTQEQQKTFTVDEIKRILDKHNKKCEECEQFYDESTCCRECLLAEFEKEVGR